LAAAEIPATLDPALLPAYQVLRPGLAVGGKPSPETLAKLKEHGFKTVVDLRMPSEGLEEEKALVEGQGLRYVSIPVSAATLTREDAAAVGRILDDPAAGPVLLHCSTSNRVGAVLALREAAGGRAPEAAIEEGRKAGLKNETLVDTVRRLLGLETPAKP
jgi:uncharacterized protein (TIGR01244 family)